MFVIFTFLIAHRELFHVRKIVLLVKNILECISKNIPNMYVLCHILFFPIVMTHILDMPPEILVMVGESLSHDDLVALVTAFPV